ncbi:MAG: 50S ribosomal protein L11 methyltransferase [Caldimonas sp.]
MFEVTVLALAASAEAVSDLLVDECEALSASVEDADADTAAERSLYGEPGMPVESASWPRSIVKALFHDIESAQGAATQVLAQFVDDVTLRSIEVLADRDWVTLTQMQFSPVEIVEGFWVVPTWHRLPASAVTVIRLDPGMAFGTGTHPTTRMCLRWIAQQAQQAQRSDHDWSRVLDYGCGSGILAIGAGLHGASHIDAVDIDPQAVTSTELNARANGVELHAGTPDMARGRHGLVLANILSTPLKLLAPLLCGHLQPGGQLVLAGILERQAEEITAAYGPWLALDVTDRDDGWVLMTGRLTDPEALRSTSFTEGRGA